VNDSDQLTGRDNGAALILAIGFVLLIGAITAGLASLVTSGIYNRINLEQVRDRQYAAEGAIELAIASARSVLDGAIGCTADTDASTTTQLNATDIRVDWTNACGVVRSADGLVLIQRNLVFTACIDLGQRCAETDTIVHAQVNFEQGSTGAVTKTYIQSWSVTG